MKRIVFVFLCCSALFLGTTNTFAGSITYKLLWSGATWGNSATAEGTITLDTALVPNPGYVSGQNPFGTTFSNFVMTVSGASSGNGTFSSAARDFNGWNWDSGCFGIGVLDLTREFVDQNAGVCLWGRPYAGGGGNMNFSAAYGSRAPQGTDTQLMTTNEGQGDNMILISMVPVTLEGIFISSITVTGGDTHECTSENGSNINASANVTANNDSIESIEWLLDGYIIGTGSNVNLTASLGVHELTVNATALSGNTDSKSTSITVRDTTSPEISVEFIDTKTNTIVNTIDRKGLTRLIASYEATDICDTAPTVTATGGFDIVNESFLPLKVHENEIIMDIPEIMISAIATDSSGNSKSSSATLMFE